jgi:methylmalonyl-CoA/ethylmalonyl-CoA epimerase
MIRRVHHVGVAVGSVEEALSFWRDALGMRVERTEEVPSEKVRVAFLPAGESRVELLQATDPASAIGRFLERRGPGIHHLTLEVADVQSVLDRLAARGLPMLDREPRRGAGGTRVAFVHPRATGGILLELVEGGAGETEGVGPFPSGSAVLVYLREPQEKVWGILRELGDHGVTVEGLDLASFEVWMAEVERGEPMPVGPSALFDPMGRVEKILLDRPSGPVPSLSERFRERTGMSPAEALLGRR